MSLKHRLKRSLGKRMRDLLGQEVHNEVAAQKSLMQQYRALTTEPGKSLPSLLDVGFRKYSQFEEDGILLYLFSLIRPINRICVELCAGNGRECNTANLIINHGWWGHLFDGDVDNVRRGIEFYTENRDTLLYPPHFTHAWLTAENVNELLLKSGASGPIDLLSLDIDGMDYWVWKAIEAIEPQVVVCEIHNLIPPELALTVPYAADFVCESEFYRGASLAAMVKLGRDKGYRLVGMHRFGFNAFFVRDGLAELLLPTVVPASCLNDPYTRQIRERHWPAASKLDWQAV